MYTGLYINLDRSADRRERLERQLRHLGLAERYKRLPAVDGRTIEARPPLTAGEVGCFLSHCHALYLAAASNVPTHVLEDDAMLSPKLPVVIASAIAGGLLNKFDIVFLDISVPFEPALWTLCRRQAVPNQIAILDINGGGFASTASYLVSPAGGAKLAAICQDLLDRKPRPIDLAIRDESKAGRVRACALLPFATTLHLDHSQASTVGVRQYDPGGALGLAMRVLRYSFFIDADLDGYAHPFLDTVRALIADAPAKHTNRQARAVLEFLGRA